MSLIVAAMVTRLVRTTAINAQVAHQGHAIACSVFFMNAERPRRADAPEAWFLAGLVEPRGIEPLTFAMPLRRSPS